MNTSKGIITLFSFVVFNLAAWAQPVIIRPPLPVDIAQSSACRQDCHDGNLNITFMTHTSLSGKRECPERVSFQVSCAPYNCEGNAKNCLTSCSHNGECATGFFCNSNQRKCMPLSYYCASQNVAAGTDGSSYDCSPFVCEAGRCKEQCSTTNDCSGRFVCNTQTRDCVVP